MHLWRVSIGVTQKLNRNQMNYELPLNALTESQLHDCRSSQTVAPDSTDASGKEHTDAKDHFYISHKNDAHDHHRRSVARAVRSC